MGTFPHILLISVITLQGCVVQVLIQAGMDWTSFRLAT